MVASRTFYRFNRRNVWRLVNNDVKREIMNRIGGGQRESVTVELIKRRVTPGERPSRRLTGDQHYLAYSRRYRNGVFRKTNVSTRQGQRRRKAKREFKASAQAKIRSATSKVGKQVVQTRKAKSRVVTTVKRRALAKKIIYQVLDGTRERTTVRVGNLIKKRELAKMLLTTPLDSKVLISVSYMQGDGSEETVKYAINNDTRDRLFGILDETVTYVTRYGSDADIDKAFLGRITSVKIENLDLIDDGGTTLKSGIKKQTGSGAFFKYHNLTKLDLSKYGIFDGTETPEDYKENCLVRALREGGCPEHKLTQVKMFCKNRLIPMNKLPHICKSCDFSINLQKDTGSAKDKKGANKYGKNTDEVYHLATVDHHYFLNEKVDCTKTAIKKYEKVYDHPKWNRVFAIDKRGKFRFSNTRQITSFRLVKMLLENKETLLKPIVYSKEMMGTQFHDKCKVIDSLHYDPSCVDLINIEEDSKKPKAPKPKKKKKKKKKPMMKSFADFETVTEGSKHVPYLCAIVSRRFGKRVFRGWDCAKQMLDFLDDKYNKFNHTLIFHNAKYDFRAMVQELQINSYLTNGSAFITARGNYERISVTIKDSLKLINKPLRLFGAMFKLKQDKEVMPYNLYTRHNVDTKMVSIKDGLAHLKTDEHKQFLKNIEKWGLSQDGLTFDCVEYSARYCEIDCEVLQAGYAKFREWMLKLGEDIDTLLTCPKIADNYFYKKFCYDECYKLSNTPRHFIQQAVVGGKTMVANNKKCRVSSLGVWKEKQRYDHKDYFKGICDFDGRSMYPSAMKRIAKELGGYLKGKPKVIPDDCCNLEWLSKQTGYFVEVKVLKVRKNRAFPMLSYKDESGVRQFCNQEMVGRTIVTDKITVEDAIRFQGVDFEFIRGYYFDEGRNDTIGKVIQYVYDTRRALKDAGNSLQESYKLVLNSGYGKTVQRAPEDDISIQDTDNMKNQIYLNYNSIKEITQINENQYLVKKHQAIDKHFNLCHIGVEILSMAKRIMGEVMYLAEDLGQDIYITDTDSMHLLAHHIPVLAQEFEKQYGYPLIGKQLCQFHSDLELKAPDGVECADTISTESVFLGKKCYLNKLLGKHPETGEEHTGWHIRMKGVPSKAIHHRCHTRPKIPKSKGEPESFESLLELYKHLYEGKPVTFDLLCGGDEISFEFCKNMTVRSRRKFTRTVRF